MTIGTGSIHNMPAPRVLTGDKQQRLIVQQRLNGFGALGTHHVAQWGHRVMQAPALRLRTRCALHAQPAYQ